jgi:hypothetical protein
MGTGSRFDAVANVLANFSANVAEYALKPFPHASTSPTGATADAADNVGSMTVCHPFS